MKIHRSKTRYAQGNATIELVLVLPAFFAMIFGFFDLFLLCVQQMVLEHAASQAVRDLAIRSFQAPSEMTAYVEEKMQQRFSRPTQVNIVLRSLPTVPVSNPYRTEKTVDVIQLSLRQPFVPRFPVFRRIFAETPLMVGSHVREARVRPVGAL